MDLSTDLSTWKGAPDPARTALCGSYARLEPLDTDRHAGTLFEAVSAPGAEERFRYLPENAPAGYDDFLRWSAKAAASVDPLFFAVVDTATGRAEGRQALMRIDTAHGVIEIGHVMWGPAMTRTRIATEAFFLFADHVFGLGYRRLEWKCDNANLPSRRAAARFGFIPEGVFRQHRVVKGLNRDTAWFSIIDREWPRLREGYERWLRPDNFESTGRQRAKLTFAP